MKCILRGRSETLGARSHLNEMATHKRGRSVEQG
jgi:hypothetical protein